MTSEIDRLAGTLMVRLEPIVFMVCGVYPARSTAES